MAAGLGYKDFQTGEVLTAADVDGYLMQNIWVFASNAARDAAVTAPAEGNFAFTKDTNSLWYYDGAAWVASGATGDIEGVTAGVGISGGGTSGTVTVTNSMATEIAAKGDLIVGTGSQTFDNLSVGTNGHTLVANSSTATGLEWKVDPVADLVTTAGDILYATAADTLVRLGIGTAGQVLKVNSGATAPEWGAGGGQSYFQAFCSFNGTGTPAVLNGYNVSSITDMGTGDYRVNFTNSIASVNYTFLLSVSKVSGVISSGNGRIIDAQEDEILTNRIRVNVFSTAPALADADRVSVAVVLN